MDQKELSELLKLIKRLEFAEFKMQDGDFAMTVRSEYKPGAVASVQAPQMVSMSPAPAPAAPADLPPIKGEAPTLEDVPTGNLLEVRSPIVGTFYRSPSPDKPPFIKVGDTIATGDVVCIVEAMKLFNEIESEVSGKVVKVLVEEAKPVEYDQVLFLIDPKG